MSTHFGIRPRMAGERERRRQGPRAQAHFENDGRVREAGGGVLYAACSAFDCFASSFLRSLVEPFVSSFVLDVFMFSRLTLL